MPKASRDFLVELEDSINAAAAGLANVQGKKMFGCHALFANGNVFALVWKEGRLGVRLPDEETFNALMGLEGAAPWKAGAMVMSHWVLVPEALHDEEAALKRWVTKAHGLAISATPKAKKTKIAKAPAKKKPVAKKKISSKAKGK